MAAIASGWYELDIVEEKGRTKRERKPGIVNAAIYADKLTMIAATRWIGRICVFAVVLR
jgi:hypothetical protein